MPARRCACPAPTPSSLPSHSRPDLLAAPNPLDRHSTLWQGEFAPGEPVAAVFGWVADCLSDPMQTYELVLPSRQPLEPRAQSGAWEGGCAGAVGRPQCRALTAD